MPKSTDRKNASKLSTDHATRAAMRENKQVARYLLPDAPPSKRSKRKSSPKRVPCPLLPGVPVTPPPRKPQSWEKRSPPEPERERPGDSGSREHTEAQDVSISDVTISDVTISDVTISDVPISDVTFIDFELSASGSQLDTSFDSIGFLTNESEINPGSDIDEETEEFVPRTVGHPHSLMTAEDELPSHLTQVLDAIYSKDDIALKEAASSNPDMLRFDWSSDPDKFIGKQELFTGDSGPTINVDGLTPLDIFKLIWDDGIINTIVKETNRYGGLYTTANKIWSEITGHDIWTFLALLMLQSILILPVEREYWYPSMAMLKVGDFQNIMPYRRFRTIKQCLHFVDNDTLSTATGEDRKMKKISPIIKHLNHKFSSLYLPERYIAIDESLLLWKGRLSFVQLISTKAARVGIKSYELCESRTGYLWKMVLYTGKSDTSQLDCEETTQDEPEGATSKIVHNLVRPLLNKGHTLVMDNFYNSPLLSRTLKTKKTDTMGTLRLKRAFVPESLRNLNKSSMRHGEVVYSHTEDLTISVWHDSNIVGLISTYHSSVVGGKEKYGTYKYKPQIVLDYNMNMGGVDKKDQMLKAFPIERVRNLVWYKKLFRRLLNVSIYNAFVIFNHKKNGNQRSFRVALAQEILSMVKVANPRTEIRRTGHFPTNAGTNRSRCKMCTLKKMQSRTAFKCDTCNVNLCIVGCFKEYHLMDI